MRAVRVGEVWVNDGGGTVRREGGVQLPLLDALPPYRPSDLPILDQRLRDLARGPRRVPRDAFSA